MDTPKALPHQIGDHGFTPDVPLDWTSVPGTTDQDASDGQMANKPVFTANQLRICKLREILERRYALYGALSRRDGNHRFGMWVLNHCESYGARF